MGWYISFRLSDAQTAELHKADGRLHKSPHLTLFFCHDDSKKELGEEWVRNHQDKHISATVDSLIELGAAEKPVIAIKLASPEGAQWHQELLDLGLPCDHKQWVPHLTMIYGTGETEQAIAQASLRALPKGVELSFGKPELRLFKPRNSNRPN